MRRRCLIFLLTFGIILQSFQTPVLAAQEGRADISSETEYALEVDSLSEPEEPAEPNSSSEPEGPSEPGDSSEPEGPSKPDGSSQPEDSPEPGGPSQPEDSTEPDSSSQPEDSTESGDSSETEDSTEPGSPSETEEPSESDTSSETKPSDAEENDDSGQEEDAEDAESPEEKDEKRKLSPMQLTEEEELVEFAGDGEGIYQEGSFTVLGESESGQYDPALRVPKIIESQRAEAEEYLYQQLLAKSTQIALTQYDIVEEEIGSFVSGVLNEHPDLYFVDKQFRYGILGTKVTAIMPSYLDGFDDNAFWLMVDDAMMAVEDGMSDLEKAVALHDYIVLNCEYDYENYSAGTLPREVYTAYGTLVNRKAVCQGYALTYKLLLNKAGIECYMVTSDKMNHAWNLVKLDGQYYQVDTTWDDPVRDRLGLVGHNYMFLSDEVFQTEITNVRSAHYDWEITKGSLVVDLAADGTQYDDAFWVSCVSPIVIADGMWYYIEASGDYYSGYGIIKERNGSAGAETVLLQGIGRWDTADGRYYLNAYSGLFRMGDRLYYNTPTHICSIPIGGGTAQTETALLSAGDKHVFGVSFCQGKIWYVLKTAPGDTTGEILPATLQQAAEVEVKRITLEPEELLLQTDETAELRAVVLPSYVDSRQIVWASDDETVATVSAGTVTGIDAGSCTITASVGGKSAQCQVVVIDRPHKPVFSPENTIDKGGRLTISADSGTTIYYTMDGSDPVPADHTTTFRYTEPILIEQDTTVKAVAVSDYDENAVSGIAETRLTVCTNNLILWTEALTIVEGEAQEIEVAELPTTRSEEDIRWSTEDAAVATVDENGIVTALYEGETVIRAETENHKGETVTATCIVTVEAPEYLVTFTGFLDRVIKTEQVRKRRSATPPYYDSENPEESEFAFPEGYYFIGWDGSFENIQSDTVIKAKYGLVEYGITYVLNGAADGADNPTVYTVESEEIILSPPGEREGYLFTGWFEDEACQGNPVSIIETDRHEDITLYAGWRDERGLWMKMKDGEEAGVIPTQSYTGKAVKPAIEVWYGDRLLDAGKEYTISYKNHTNVNLLQTEADWKKAPTITIKGKGNFAGTLVKNFAIAPKSLADEDIQIDALAAAYQGGKTIKPVPAVFWNGRRLRSKKDFMVEYPDQDGEGTEAYQNPGDYSVLIKGCGNYTGEKEITLTITDPAAGEVLLSKVKVSGIPDQSYTGSAVVLTQDMPSLTLGTETLVLGEDYTLTYGSCIESGTYQVLITGQGKYKGQRRVSFKIKGLPVSSMKVSRLQNLIYTGEKVTFDPDASEDAANKLVITDKTGETILRQNRDYRLEFDNCTEAGNAKMKIIGIGAYSGTMTKTYRIMPYSLEAGSEGITAELAAEGAQPWLAGGAAPKVKVTFHGRELTEGTDYTLSYKNNKSVIAAAGKNPTVVIKGKKNFCGSRELTFTIASKNIAEVSAAAADLEENAKAGKYMSTPVLTDTNGKKLKAGTDYEKTFIYTNEAGIALGKTDRPAAGDRITVTITGKGNYHGKTQATYRILPRGNHLSKAKIKINGKFYYTGSRITLSKDDITVTIGKTTLSADDYDIVGSSYSNNINKGTAKVTIRGKGNFGGTKQVSFRILSQNMKWWEKLQKSLRDNL